MPPSRALVAVFLRNRSDILLLKRSPTIDLLPGYWTPITGPVQRDDPATTAHTLLRTETSTTQATLAQTGDPIIPTETTPRTPDRIHPYLFTTPHRDITVPATYTQTTWTPPPRILRTHTPPWVWPAYERVAPTPRTIQHDRSHGSAYLSIRALEVLRDTAATTDTPDPIRETAHRLLSARPSMTAITNRVNRAMATATTPAAIERTASDEITRAYHADTTAATNAADIIDDGPVLTLSHSGTVHDALQTTATPVIIAESRPLYEGRTLAETLATAGIRATLITDAAIAHTLATTKIGSVLVGADTILPDGTLINKTGTRAAALAASHEDVPFYAVTARDKITTDPNPQLEAGDPIDVYDGPARITTDNPHFDLTPTSLITRIITEDGPIRPDEAAAIASEHEQHTTWHDTT